MHNIVYILIVLVSCTFADVTFVTKPPKEVRTFPGQHVTLPCVVENLTEKGSVRWQQVDNIDSFKVISDNRTVHISRLENIGENYSIIGDGMNFTLLFKIPDLTDFGSDFNVTKLYICSVIKSDGYSLDIFAKSHVIIQRLNILNPICGEIKTTYVTGEILTIKCYNDPDPTIITTLKSENGSVLPTYVDKTSYVMHNFNLTKEDHNARFVCESRINRTNEIQNCSIGPITVNYKPEITITQTAAMDFYCAAEARPPVNVTHWILEPSIPQDSFIISNGVLTIIEPLKVESEMKITCEAENAIGKGNKTLSIPNMNNGDEENKSGITLVNIIISILLCIVAVIAIISLYFYKYHQNKEVTTLYDDTIVDETDKEEDGYQIPLKSVHEHYQSLKITDSINTKEDEKVVGYDYIDLTNSDGRSLEVTPSSTTTKPLKTLYDYTIVDLTSKKEDGYQIPLKSVRGHYQSLNIKESMNTKDDQKVVGFDDIDLPNAEGQRLEVTSSSAMYVNTLNKNRCRINKIESDPTSNAEGEEVTYINNPRVKKCQFPGNVHPTNIVKENDTDYETVLNLVTPDNTNNTSSHHPEKTADVHYINLKVKVPQLGE